MWCYGWAWLEFACPRSIASEKPQPPSRTWLSWSFQAEPHVKGGVSAQVLEPWNRVYLARVHMWRKTQMYIGLGSVRSSLPGALCRKPHTVARFGRYDVVVSFARRLRDDQELCPRWLELSGKVLVCHGSRDVLCHGDASTAAWYACHQLDKLQKLLCCVVLSALLPLLSCRFV